uniref:Uncharacterized protein n=1 Tax=Anguilla anguilla TaxID=7936 RepID=A0A0E9QIC0_ANGAN
MQTAYSQSHTDTQAHTLTQTHTRSHKHLDIVQGVFVFEPLHQNSSRRR